MSIIIHNSFCYMNCNWYNTGFHKLLVSDIYSAFEAIWLFRLPLKPLVVSNNAKKFSSLRSKLFCFNVFYKKGSLPHNKLMPRTMKEAIIEKKETSWKLFTNFVFSKFVLALLIYLTSRRFVSCCLQFPLRNEFAHQKNKHVEICSRRRITSIWKKMWLYHKPHL